MSFDEIDDLMGIKYLYGIDELNKVIKDTNPFFKDPS